LQWEENSLSDLASSCEYLTIDKSCSAILEGEKAKANRQLRCHNEEKWLAATFASQEENVQ
jgi:hypothetical protein